ncbi:hypothetical protein [Paenibacillus chungangensis]|uniref:Uncharacterized protein n=1 Tax=Paenibacillus chungangensis TaxID=696535 RepID=A0ABW3HQT6_9BACL
MSKTSEIRNLARKYLSKHGMLKRKEFIAQLKADGVDFTEGHIAAALSSLPDETISRIDTGVYQLNDTSMVQNPAAPDGTVEALRQKIDSILDGAVVSMKDLANVNYFEVDKEYIAELENVKKLISSIEKLKQ